ncbi:DUF732 domain-containing protein [Nocardia beijingensis]
MDSSARAKATMYNTILVATTAAALLLGGSQTAFAAPGSGSASGSSGSASGSSGSAGGSSGPARSAADRKFLRESYYAGADYDVQDAAIALAHSECNWLDAHGNSARNHITLAESSRDAVEYPYIFLDAAIDAYCPWNSI